MALSDQGPPDNQNTTRVASGRPARAAHPTFQSAAAQLLDHGYTPLPIRPGSKAPAPARWSAVDVTDNVITDWSARYPDHGVGLRTGHLVGLDIDLLDPDRAHAVQAAAIARFGETLIRVGQWPKRLLLYRTNMPFRKLAVPGVEMLGAGQQFVAFGIHPGTGQPYSWPLGETPLEVPLDGLPLVDEAALRTFLGEIGAAAPPRPLSGARKRTAEAAQANRPERDETGRVIDGRDAWLSTIAFHEVHDVVDRGVPPELDKLAGAVWDRFTVSADLERPRSTGRAYTLADAARKVADKLRLLQDARLPPRDVAAPEPDYTAPRDSVQAARHGLDLTLAGVCARVLAWHEADAPGPPPRVGLQATVGLGKSVTSRRHLLDLQRRLTAAGLPDRILVFTPSHALAEEAAAAWRECGAGTAVLRGYERLHPERQVPMCGDHPAMRAAIEAGVSVQEAACTSPDGNHRCRFYDTCLKQENRRELADADVIVAPYDALFSGFGVEPDSIALLLIDEACWPRAVRDNTGLHVETLDAEPLDGLADSLFRNAAAGRMADLSAVRSRARMALGANGPGPLDRRHLTAAGLTAEECRHAAQLERRRARDPGLRPGLSNAERAAALWVANTNARIERLAGLWAELSDLLDGPEACNGRIRCLPPDRTTGLSGIAVTGLAPLHPNLRGKPVLHLDATLRPELAAQVLPGLEIIRIEADAPHMQLTLVSGGFGKSALCPDGAAAQAETARRVGKLSACVDYVRWQAARMAPGRLLVVTYKACREAFEGIPGVDTAHFNAIAGLDAWRDVAALIVIGRPLPRDSDLDPLTAALFRQDTSAGTYRAETVGVRMRGGSARAVRVIRHSEETAEALRAAICDDELIQAIGRGRGVNHTAGNPLEVHVLADVALPLVHDRVTTWDMEAPDLIQRMLLVGIAVDSPADAAALHPGMFGNGHQAKMAFERAAFKAQIPIRDTYRGMCLKSARYRRSGRGRSWQTACWIDGTAEETHAQLGRVLAPLAEWRPNDG